MTVVERTSASYPLSTTLHRIGRWLAYQALHEVRAALEPGQVLTVVDKRPVDMARWYHVGVSCEVGLLDAFAGLLEQCSHELPMLMWAAGRTLLFQPLWVELDTRGNLTAVMRPGVVTRDIVKDATAILGTAPVPEGVPAFRVSRDGLAVRVVWDYSVEHDRFDLRMDIAFD